MKLMKADEIQALFTSSLLTSIKRTSDNLLLSIFMDTCDSLLLYTSSNDKIICCRIFEKLATLIEYSWELIHSVHWKNTNIVFRDIYSLGVYLKLYLIIDESIYDFSSRSKIKDLIKQADRAILLGSNMCREQLQALITTLTEKYHSLDNFNDDYIKPNIDINQTQYIDKCCYQRCVPTLNNQRPNLRQSIDKITTPSLVTFLNKYLNQNQPVVLRGCLDDWPAMNNNSDNNNNNGSQRSCWSNLDYLKKGMYVYTFVLINIFE